MLKNKKKSYLKRLSLRNAFAISLLLHTILVADILTFNFEPLEKEPELLEFDAILLTKNIAEPPPPAPEPPPPEPPPPAPEPTPQAVIPKRIPVPVPLPVPVPVPPKEDLVPKIEKKSPVEPKPVEQKQESVASAPEPVAVPETGEDDTRNAGLVALDNFSRELAIHIAKYKEYPRIAQRRAWQGEVILEVKLTGLGQLISKRVRRSSGFKVLDTEGLDMIDRSAPFPVPPSILSERTFTILVPIKFVLY